MLLQVEKIKKSFGTHRVFDGLSFTADRGEVVGILGGNGAGKTTLLRIINCLLEADGGQILFEGHPMTRNDLEVVGYLPEERGLYRRMRVGEQVVFLARLKGLSKADAEASVHEWFQRLGVEEWWRRPVSKLSKGMQQKVQFVASVAHRPQLLVLDEPFSGFDPVNTEQLKREIIRLKEEGAAILFSTHNMSSVEEVCQEITLINHSEVVLQGRVDEIRHKYRTHKFRVMLEDGQEFDYQLPKGLPVHDAIAQLNAQYPLAGFHEVLPTMQQIFMQAVGAADKLKVNS